MCLIINLLFGEIDYFDRSLKAYINSNIILFILYLFFVATISTIYSS